MLKNLNMNVNVFFINMVIFLVLLITLTKSHKIEAASSTKTIMAVILTQNEEISLPYFLSFFQRLTYPKNKISLYIRSGNNHDKTKDILMAWIRANIHKYKSINSYLDDKKFNYDELLEKSLQEAKKGKYDYYWNLNQMSILTNQDVLQRIIEEKLTVAAPMVETVHHYYTNFWGKMSEDYSYVRSDDYIDIYSSEKRGCHNVALLDSLFLVDLSDKKSENLTFDKNLLVNYEGPSDTRIVFAESAKQSGIHLHICNNVDYGRIMTPYMNHIESLQEVKNALHQDKIPFNVSDEFLPFMKYPKIDNFGFDKIYVINLKRRPFRKQIMKEKTKDVGLEVQFFEGIDGESLNELYLSNIGYGPNKHYKEEFLTTGSIGCALSHYHVWEDALNSKYSKVLILEDDVEFDKNFREKMTAMLKEVDELKLSWDLIYLDRYPVNAHKHTQVNNSELLVTFEHPSYRTSAYILSHSGATKLYQQEYISNLLPVDEYISLRFWPADKRYSPLEKINFPVNLNVFSIEPITVSQTNYGYSESDTIGTKFHLDAFGQFAKSTFEQMEINSRVEL